MENLKITTLFFALGTTLLSACGVTVVNGSGNIISEVRQVSHFDAVDMADSGEVIILQGEDEAVKVEADDNLMQYIRTEVRGHTLHIYHEPMDMIALHTTQPVRIYVSMKNVSALSLSGSGAILADEIKTPVLELNKSGSGKIDIKDLEADRVTTDLSGSGNCELRGVVREQTILLSGSGNYKSTQLTSEKVKVDLSGSGKVYVQAGDALNVNISGSGNVIYSGTPALSQHISGSGKIVAE